MKKLIKISVLLFIIASLVGCDNKKYYPGGDPPDTEFITYYTYINKSSWDISIEAVSLDVNTNETTAKEFTIPKYKSYELEFYNEPDYPYPFKLDELGFTIDRLKASNGNVVVIQRKQPGIGALDELYRIENYIRTEERPHKYKKIVRYTYTFTDDFFKDGEPIE